MIWIGLGVWLFGAVCLFQLLGDYGSSPRISLLCAAIWPLLVIAAIGAAPFSKLSR